MELNYNEPLENIYSKLNSSSHGLTSKEASIRLKNYGNNVYDKENGFEWLKILISQFENPLTILLLIVVVLSLFSGDKLDSLIVILMILLNSIIGFIQEFKAHKSLKKLKQLIKHTVKVIRDGKIVSIDSTDLVLGDIVILNKGSILPADVRIISSTNLFINESSLTGESVDVNKNSEDHIFDSTLPQYITNCGFQGTSVTEGAGQAIVIATGKNTVLGNSVDNSEVVASESNYMKNINKFSKILFYFVLAITVVVLLINISLGRGILVSLTLGISLALGMTPETMPLIISIALSSAAYKLSKQNVLIKRLSVFEDFGNVDIICTDKTGTITKGNLEVEGGFDLNGNKSDKVIELSAICNASNPQIKGKIFENTIDTNIWEYAHKNKIAREISSYSIIKVWDFDFASRDSAVLINHSVKNPTLIVKGALEEILKLTDLSNQDFERVTLISKKYEDNGNKVILVASKEFDSVEDVPEDRKDFKSLQLIGFLLLKDQPRDNIEEEIQHLENLNIKLKILTGDSAEVTKQICEKVNLEIIENKLILGDDLEKALEKSQSEFDYLVENYNIFARVNPTQKLRIIESLKKQQHVVAYMGDGINDVGSLNVADVGIAVNTAVDVAKDSADIIILNSKLTTVTKGVEEGRKIFANSMKFVFSTMSSSFGNIITIVFASILLDFIPLLPVQVILLDFLSDFQHLAVSSDKVDKEMTKSPRNWDFKIFTKYVIYWGVISTIFDFVHILTINYFTSSPEMFRSTWLIESVVTEILATISLRTHLPFYKSIPGRLMVIFSIIPIFGVVGINYLSDSYVLFGLEPPPLKLLMAILAIVLIYLTTLEFSKKSYFREFWGIGNIIKSSPKLKLELKG